MCDSDLTLFLHICFSLITGEVKSTDIEALTKKIRSVHGKNGPFDHWFAFSEPSGLLEAVQNATGLPDLHIITNVECQDERVLTANRLHILKDGLRVGVLVSTANELLDRPMDIFFSFECPRKLVTSADDPSSNLDAQMLRIRSRYHFSPSESFFEARPYEVYDEDQQVIFASRFISLAPALSESSKVSKICFLDGFYILVDLCDEH